MNNEIRNAPYDTLLGEDHTSEVKDILFVKIVKEEGNPRLQPETFVPDLSEPNFTVDHIPIQSVDSKYKLNTPLFRFSYESPYTVFRFSGLEVAQQKPGDSRFSEAAIARTGTLLRKELNTIIEILEIHAYSKLWLDRFSSYTRGVCPTQNETIENLIAPQLIKIKDILFQQFGESVQYICSCHSNMNPRFHFVFGTYDTTNTNLYYENSNGVWQGMQNELYPAWSPVAYGGSTISQYSTVGIRAYPDRVLALPGFLDGLCCKPCYTTFEFEKKFRDLQLQSSVIASVDAVAKSGNSPISAAEKLCAELKKQYELYKPELFKNPTKDLICDLQVLFRKIEVLNSLRELLQHGISFEKIKELSATFLENAAHGYRIRKTYDLEQINNFRNDDLRNENLKVLQNTILTLYQLRQEQISKLQQPMSRVDLDKCKSMIEDYRVRIKKLADKFLMIQWYQKSIKPQEAMALMCEPVREIGYAIANTETSIEKLQLVAHLSWWDVDTLPYLFYKEVVHPSNPFFQNLLNRYATIDSITWSMIYEMQFLVSKGEESLREFTELQLRALEKSHIYLVLRILINDLNLSSGIDVVPGIGITECIASGDWSFLNFRVDVLHFLLVQSLMSNYTQRNKIKNIIFEDWTRSLSIYNWEERQAISAEIENRVEAVAKNLDMIAEKALKAFKTKVTSNKILQAKITQEIARVNAQSTTTENRHTV